MLLPSHGLLLQAEKAPDAILSDTSSVYASVYHRTFLLYLWLIGFNHLTLCSVSRSSHVLLTSATSEVFASGPRLVSVVHVLYEIQELWLMFVPTLTWALLKAIPVPLGLRLVTSVYLISYSRASPCLFLFLVFFLEENPWQTHTGFVKNCQNHTLCQHLLRTLSLLQCSWAGSRLQSSAYVPLCKSIGHKHIFVLATCLSALLQLGFRCWNVFTK